MYQRHKIKILVSISASLSFGLKLGTRLNYNSKGLLDHISLQNMVLQMSFDKFYSNLKYYCIRVLMNVYRTRTRLSPTVSSHFETVSELIQQMQIFKQVKAVSDSKLISLNKILKYIYFRKIKDNYGQFLVNFFYSSYRFFSDKNYRFS